MYTVFWVGKPNSIKIGLDLQSPIVVRQLNTVPRLALKHLTMSLPDQKMLEQAVSAAVNSYGREGDLGRMNLKKFKERQIAVMFQGSKIQKAVRVYSRAASWMHSAYSHMRMHLNPFHVVRYTLYARCTSYNLIQFKS